MEQDDDEELEHQTATSAAQSGGSEADEPEDLSSSDESYIWFTDAPPHAEPLPKRATPATRSTGLVPSMTPSSPPFPRPTAAAQCGTRRATDTVRNQKIKSLVARQCMLLRIHNDDLRSNADIAFDYGQLVELRWKYVRRKGLEWDRPLSRYDMGKIFAEDLYDWFMDERPPDPPSWAWWEKQTTHNKQKRVCVCCNLTNFRAVWSHVCVAATCVPDHDHFCDFSFTLVVLSLLIFPLAFPQLSFNRPQFPPGARPLFFYIWLSFRIPFDFFQRSFRVPSAFLKLS